MSLAHELTLDSQVELLERLQLLTRYSSNFVNVSGSKGAGKSWLAQRYLEHWADDKNQSLLMCHPNQDDEQHRSTILSQLVSDPLFNPKDSLSDSFNSLFADSSCDVVIVIDDAHLLSDILLSELWMWLLDAQSHPLWRVNVVLFALPNRLEPLLTRLSYGQESKPVDVEIESLSQPEADRLFEQRVMRYVDDDRERQVRQAFKKVKRLPGDIMALAEQKMEKRIVIRSIIGSPLNIALVVILVLLIIGGGYWWMWSQPSPDEKAQQLTQGIEQTAIPTLSDNEAVRMDDVAGDVSASTPQADDDSAALPPAVPESREGVGEADSAQQRVVITSDVVDALLDDKAQPAADVTAMTQNSDGAPEKQSDDISEPEGAVNESQPATSAVSFSFARQELNAMSPRSYTLQLAAVNSLPEVQRFIDQYQLQDQVNVYPTVRNDTEWYIITYRNYPTIQLARDAVATLPQPLQSLGPWAKSLSQVQREIARGQ